ncbi:MAG: hypothetical protein HY744_05830 [Deltaproteobacteria bacterium]|nr:hypothetical protein [Deltaproteobacteria bacterium]
MNVLWFLSLVWAKYMAWLTTSTARSVGLVTLGAWAIWSIYRANKATRAAVRAIAERDKAEAKISGDAWPPERALGVRIASPRGHEVILAQEESTLRRSLEFVNHAPFPVKVIHINVTWLTYLGGLLDKTVDDTPTGSEGTLQEGEAWTWRPQNKQIVPPGKPTRVFAGTGIAARVEVEGSIIVASGHWDEDKTYPVSTSAWYSVLDTRP